MSREKYFINGCFLFVKHNAYLCKQYSVAIPTMRPMSNLQKRQKAEHKKTSPYSSELLKFFSTVTCLRMM